MSVLIPIIETWDGANRRAFLAQGVSDFYPIEDIYHEYRNARKVDEELRKYNALLRAEGNIPKGGGAFTPRYVVLLDGFKLIPYNETLQINQLGDMITDDPDTDATLYDTSSLTVPKVIYIKPSEAETIQLNSGAIEYSSYGNFVTINTERGQSGIDFPIGTLQYPSDNIADTLSILHNKGFQEINVIGDLTIGADGLVENIILKGQSVLRSRLVLLDAAETNNVEISTATVSGVLDGSASIRECLIDGISYVSGYLVDSGLTIEPVVLGNNAQASLINCFSNVSGSETPTIDMGGSGQSLAVRDYAGGLKIVNRTGTDPVSIDMDSGHVIIDSTCTAGTITVRGSFKLTDNSSAGCTVDTVGRVAMQDDVPTATEIATETLTLDVSCP